ncbi:MAG: hypothetical protein ABI685_10225 [Ferruginibacter sp.]
MKTIKIFLASSSSLAEYRKDFEIEINRINKTWVQKGIFLELIIWENFVEYMVKKGKQKEYDASASTCDIFILLYSNFVGKYSIEEFKYAAKSFRKSTLDVPRIFTYYIEPAEKTKENEGFKTLTKMLSDKEHYTSKNKNFQEILGKFRADLTVLTEKYEHFFFPDLTPRIDEKVQYIKMLHLTRREVNKAPVYKKYIERLQAEKEVFDEAQFSELLIYSAPGKITESYNYGLSENVSINVNVIIPPIKKTKKQNSLREDEKIANSQRNKFSLDSNVFFSVTDFINAFQEGNTYYQTKVDEPIRRIQLFVDFSAIPYGKKIMKSPPSAELYPKDKNKKGKALTVTEVRPNVYLAEALNLQAGYIVVMRFDINWNEVS